jgi:hypothetical protein
VAYNREAKSRISRVVKLSERSVTPLHRQRQRRQAPSIPGGGGGILVVAKHNESLPKATLDRDEDKVIITAVEVRIYKIVPVDPEAINPGEEGEYKFEPLGTPENPQKAVVANFSPTDAIPAGEWFLILPTNGRIKAATIWPC